MSHRSIWKAASSCIASAALACGGADPVEPASTESGEVAGEGGAAAEPEPALPEPSAVAPEAPSPPLAEPSGPIRPDPSPGART